jgi:hypothetical protein
MFGSVFHDWNGNKKDPLLIFSFQVLTKRMSWIYFETSVRARTPIGWAVSLLDINTRKNEARTELWRMQVYHILDARHEFLKRAIASRGDNWTENQIVGITFEEKLLSNSFHLTYCSCLIIHFNTWFIPILSLNKCVTKFWPYFY